MPTLLRREPLRHFAGKDRINVRQDLLWSAELRAHITARNQITSRIEQNERWNSRPGIFSQILSAFELREIDGRPRHVGFAHVGLEFRCRMVTAIKYNLEFRMLLRDPIVIIHQLRSEFATRSAPMC